MQEIAIAVQLVNTHAVQNHMATGMILEQVYLQIWKKRLPRTHKQGNFAHHFQFLLTIFFVLSLGQHQSLRLTLCLK